MTATPGHPTRREIQILQGVADGLTARQIARRLYISVCTVNTHKGNAYRKLGVNNGVAAVAIAARRRLIYLGNSKIRVCPVCGCDQLHAPKVSA